MQGKLPFLGLFAMAAGLAVPAIIATAPCLQAQGVVVESIGASSTGITKTTPTGMTVKIALTAAT